MGTTEREIWIQQKTWLKTHYPNLTDKDLEFEQGKEAEMIARVAKKVDTSRDSLYAILSLK